MHQETKREGVVGRRSRWLGVGVMLVGLLGCGTGGDTTSMGAPGGTAGGQGGIGGGGGAVGSGAGGAGGTGAAGGGGTGGSGQIVMPQGTSLFIEVKDPDGSPIPNAWVLMENLPDVPIDKHTDEYGQLLLENLKPGRLVAQVRADGYAEGTAVAEVEIGMHGGALVVLHPFSNPIAIDANAISTIVRDGVEVTIPADSLVDDAGMPVVGEAAVTIIPLDPTRPGAMPGPLEGLEVIGGERVPLESFFMADISVWQGGKRLQLAPGATATLRFPIPDAHPNKPKLGDVIDAWSFDIGSGVWLKEGVGVIEVSPTDSSKLVWKADVHHFTYWNSDSGWWESQHCYDITVKDASGNVVPDQWVTSVGVTYLGIGWAKKTNMYGKVCVGVQLANISRIYLGYTNHPSTPISPLTAHYEMVEAGTEVSACSGQGAPCEPLTITMPAMPGVVCTAGQQQTCGPSVQAVGICHGSSQFCNSSGTGWGPCGGQVLPQQEACGNGLDDDCDGSVDEGNCMPVCALGQKKECYLGSSNHIITTTSYCQKGEQFCTATGIWGPCLGDVKGLDYDLCAPGYIGRDTNCDGVDTCECVPGTSTTDGCFGTSVGECYSGARQCTQKPNGPVGSSYDPACIGYHPPDPEKCTGGDNGKDEDCDGIQDPEEFATGDCCNPNMAPGNQCTRGQAGCNLETPPICDGDWSCVYDPWPYNKVAPIQESGNCREERCDGTGMLRQTGSWAIKDSDKDDLKPCTLDSCSNGNPSHPGIGDYNPCQNVSNSYCLSGQCTMSTCMDGVLFGLETDVDCGGGVCVTCADLKSCGMATDCTSGVCSGGVCAIPTCNDNVRNGTDTDIDCGGATCLAIQNGPKRCNNGQLCAANTDCKSASCTNQQGTLKCQATSCNNGMKDVLETDVDCGGTSCNPCLYGKTCALFSDCLSGACSNTKCICTTNAHCPAGQTCNVSGVCQ